VQRNVIKSERGGLRAIFAKCWGRTAQKPYGRLILERNQGLPTPFLLKLNLAELGKTFNQGLSTRGFDSPHLHQKIQKHPEMGVYVFFAGLVE